MSIENVKEKLKRIEIDLSIQNLIAQANARYILFNTTENKENFPNYTINDDSLTVLAFYYLEIGAKLAERNQFSTAIDPFNKGASILEYVYGSEQNKKELSNYYELISALAYYVCFQYSKSFILINKVKHNTLIANLISLFLQRDFYSLQIKIDETIIDDSYSDEFLSQSEDDEDLIKIYEITIAKALNGFIKYFYSENKELLEESKKLLKNLGQIAELEQAPDIWWIIRLLLMISEGFSEASLWDTLKNYFDTSSDIIKRYIYSLTYQTPRGVYELFITQRKSLEKVLNADNVGCVVSIPTSSGKTRIAEIAILDCLIKEPNSKVLYIAPFRSLAFEVENSLGKIFENIGIEVSQLYGGSLFSKLDMKIIDEAQIIIATPEKAKAMIRGNQDIINDIKLIVIDEGHLFGPDKRHIVNEIFYEELRYYMDKNGGKFLLLSAVLPNPEELALWLSKSEKTVFKDNWRPSDERIGILEWTGETVNLNWESNDSERNSYNRRFIVREEQPLIGRQKKIRYFPSDKNEAVAATAYKLKVFGTVLIFVGVKRSVFTMARAYLKCLGHEPPNFSWKNQRDWNAFELSCKETYGENCEWLEYAKKGILCHNADLHTDVRLPLERLMRLDKPLVIICTSTLGQGVNLGVSSVIFSTVFQGTNELTPRDFWNIAGRAGRAFVDHEGKILVALDKSDKSSRQARSKITWYETKIKSYFDKENIDIAKSGILILIKFLKSFALENNIDFNILLQLISENNLKQLGDNAKNIDDILDWIDDTLLALHALHNKHSKDISIEWIEDFFSKSLSYIQAVKDEDIIGDEIISFAKARINGITQKVGIDKMLWVSIIKSGIPLNSDLIIEDNLDKIIGLISDYIVTEKTIDNKIILLSEIESQLLDIPVFNDINISSSEFEKIRESWLKGFPISRIIQYDNGIGIITNFYTFIFPWVLNGVAKKIRNKGLEEEADIMEEISLLVENGLPNVKSVKIYQAGIRSRVAAKEIGDLYPDEIWDNSISSYKRDLVIHSEFYKENLSKHSCEWLDLLSSYTKREIQKINPIFFKFGNIHEKSKTLMCRTIAGQQYLISPDYSVIEKIKKTNVDFSNISNKEGVYFKYNRNKEYWELDIKNPYISVSDMFSI